MRSHDDGYLACDGDGTPHYPPEAPVWYRDPFIWAMFAVACAAAWILAS